MEATLVVREAWNQARVELTRQVTHRRTPIKEGPRSRGKPGECLDSRIMENSFLMLFRAIKRHKCAYAL